MKKTLLFLSVFLFAFATNVKADFIVEDFESNPTLEMLQKNGEGTGSASVVADPTDANGKSALITTSDYDALLKLNVTLPAGKTLADYASLSFDIYLKADVYKKMNIYVDDTKIYEDDGYPSQGAKTTWLTKTYVFSSLTLLGTADLAKNSFALCLGISTDEGDYYIDNVVLQETKTNLVLDNFETKTIGAKYNVYNTYNVADKGTATVTADPADASGKSVNVVVNDYNTYLSLDVVLPAGKTLANYESLSFDVYWKKAEYKNMHVYIDEDNIFAESDYPSQGAAEKWITKTFVFSKLTLMTPAIAAKSSFALNIGINADVADYYIDNIILTEGEGGSTEPPVYGASFDFETGNISGWGTPNQGAGIEITQEDKHSGSYAVKLSASATSENEWDLQFQSPTVVVEQGSAYRISFWAKAVGGGGDMRISTVASGQLFDSNNNEDRQYLPSKEITADWTEYTYDLVYGANLVAGASSLQLNFDMGKVANKVYYLDDIKVEDITTTTNRPTYSKEELSLFVSNNTLYLSKQMQEVQIYDLNGSLRISAQYVSSVDVSALTSGIYLTKIVTNGETYVNKIVK